MKLSLNYSLNVILKAMKFIAKTAINIRSKVNFKVFFALALLFSLPVMAQINGTDVLAPYRDFRPAEDLASRVMEGLLGPTYASPLTAGSGANTLFGAIFLVFNIVVFAVGIVWASYGVIAGIVQTADEGTILGKRMSSVWMPVRMVTGIGGLIPAFGGFSLSQVAMILATSWGISFGNYAYNQALGAAASGVTLTNSSFSKTDPGRDANTLTTALFDQRICERSLLKKEADTRAAGVTVSARDAIQAFPLNMIESGTVVGRSVGTIEMKSKCWAAGVKQKPFSDPRNESSWSGFRSGAVNYDAINKGAWAAYSNSFPELSNRVNALADAYYDKIESKAVEEARIPRDELRATSLWYSGSISRAGAEIDQKAIKEAALQNMGKYGFFSAGSFYSTFAEANAVAMSATDAVDYIVIPPPEKAKSSSGDYEEAMTRLQKGADSSADTQRGSCFVALNATGNCSIGQKIMEVAIGAGTSGAGGGAQIVDPIIALKNIGDYMMITGETILVVAAGAAGLNKVVDGVAGDDSILGKTAGKFAKKLLGPVTAVIGAAAQMLPYIGGLMFAVGALCAIYIPMVPFIIWVSGLVQYCCIVVESFAAAPLWALAHLQADGEGMGQRTERGYLYLINLLFRPILMVVAFFAASALVILLGCDANVCACCCVCSRQLRDWFGQHHWLCLFVVCCFQHRDSRFIPFGHGIGG
jgi:conjugal transfer/type IV secretion protein DotA/TraY